MRGRWRGRSRGGIGNRSIGGISQERGVDQLNASNDGPNRFLAFTDRLSECDEVAVDEQGWGLRNKGTGRAVGWAADMRAVMGAEIDEVCLQAMGR